jgi:hypothetical protein
MGLFHCLSNTHRCAQAWTWLGKTSIACHSLSLTHTSLVQISRWVKAHFVWSWLQNGQCKVSYCIDICLLDLYLHVWSAIKKTVFDLAVYYQ